MKRNTRRDFSRSEAKAKKIQGFDAQPTMKQMQWNQTNGLNSVKLSEAQEELKQKILDNRIVFVEGSAGTGKTMGVLYTYVQEYLKDKTKQIIYIRTPVEAGMDKIGALPDGLDAKIEPHFMAAQETLETLLTKSKVENDLGSRIHFKIPNFCLGCTFDNALVFIDEAQQLPPMILKLLLERTGKNTKVVIGGDNTQLYVDSKGRNALIDAIPRFFTEEFREVETIKLIDEYSLTGPREVLDIQEIKVKVPRYEEIEYHKFFVKDVMRDEIVKSVIQAYGGD